MNTLDRTNRGVYQRILDATRDVSRSLEEYLRALWRLGSGQKASATVPAALFGDLVIQAIRAPAPPFDDTWRSTDFDLGATGSEFDAWERVILSQIADLRDFAEGPEQQFPELGVDVPRRPADGNRANPLRWYNHSVRSYLECAMAGAFGGWDLGDGVRKSLPDPAGQFHPEPPEAILLPPLSWAEMTEFLICGQTYE
ncbi:MAG TPA: hypothetical protein VJ914_39880 [Pseudonocardiaceae bacterium]|nr:hypothetical protein [Pseudonocardiaceae bacterium]